MKLALQGILVSREVVITVLVIGHLTGVLVGATSWFFEATIARDSLGNL